MAHFLHQPAAPDARQMQTPDPAPEETQPKSRHILLVNEQRSFQMMMKAMLINIGINRITYTNSRRRGARRCQKESFDIYLLDYELGSGKTAASCWRACGTRSSSPRAW